MKNLIKSLLEEFNTMKSSATKEDAVHIYIVLSFILVCLFACSDSIICMMLAVLNLANAERLGYKYIPGFGKEG